MDRVRPARIAVRDFNITSMTEHDLNEVVEIEEMCSLSRWGWEAYYNELVNCSGSLMLVARRTSAVAAYDGPDLVGGFIASRLADHQLQINNVAVRPDYRRRGLGRSLMSAVLRNGELLGAREALLEVRAGNVEAQSLYRASGFAPAGRRKNYYTAPQEDALIMTWSNLPSLSGRSAERRVG